MHSQGHLWTAQKVAQVRVFLPIRCFFPGTDPEFKPLLKQWGSMQSTTMIYLRIVIVTGPFF